MQQTSNKITYLGLILPGFLWAGRASAQVCPVCVVAIGAGLGFSRWFGIDDIVSSVWIGAMLMALILWTVVWLKKKKWNFPEDGIVIAISYMALTYIPLYYAGIVGNPKNQIWGLDKIIFGSLAGTVAFFIGHWINLYLKKKNDGKAMFPFQKVLLPVAALFLTSILLYLLLIWRII